MLHIFLALFDRNEFVVAFGMYVVDESAEVTFAPYLYARRFFRAIFDWQQLLVVMIEVAREDMLTATINIVRI